MTAPDATVVAPPLAPRRAARLGSYTLWQVRDYALHRGAPTLIVALLFGYLAVTSMYMTLDARRGAASYQVRQYGSVEAAQQAMLHDASMGLVAGFIGIYAFLGALIGVNGIVSNDRKFGFYRFLFAKPVAPSALYGTEFAVNGLGFLVLTVALALLYGTIVEPILSAPLLIVIMAAYLCYAGLGFALSAISRWDWLSLVAVAGAAEVLWKFYGDSTSPFAALLRLLPPLNRTADVYSAAAHGVALPWHSVFWLAGYGVVAFIAGLAILRHRRLAFN